eukprot:CAMPEP_0171386318 /NCGR_PEP_ID=MMETSP0879-20121228/39430_1 /TAXON_ID=67004 /ORGANISM="Thalassiosira weissflogii, Strain CCMP1336" /LENGTH=1739 /DNA_ID=CAMNT_0011898635 /DNA_START=171 /DNA_END=5387 /DNA_ORIENTATION=-
MMSNANEALANIRVLVRVRPLNERESKFNPTSALSIDNGDMTPTIDFGNSHPSKQHGVKNGSSGSGGTIHILDPSSTGNNSHGLGYSSDGNSNVAAAGGQSAKTFTYDAVFGPLSQQVEIFDSVKGIIDAVCAGYNGTIVAYGQTGSGKSHTIFGEEGSDDNSKAGLVQRSLKAIFHKIAESHVENNADNPDEDGSTIHTTTKASFFEIYNERVYDLLSDGALDEALPVREDSSNRVYVEGLTEMTVSNTSDAMEVLRCGIDNRRVAATKMNHVSSRSHAVFALAVKSEVTSNDGVKKIRMSKFTLVDLAGSERQKATDASGDRLKEASMINSSLLCLGQVINALVEKEQGKMKHVPFRESKLTFLLKDSWGGNSKTCLVATVTPSMTSLTETISTLKFAQRAKQIKNTAVLNEDTCGSIAALQAEISRLKSELESSTLVRLLPVSESNDPLKGATISALRNQYSKLNNEIKALKDVTNKRASQVQSLKRKLQQETMMRKVKERRIDYLSGKSKSDSTEENGEVEILREEVRVLRAQLESQPADPELIEWMLKYKEVKAKVDELENADERCFSPIEKNELEESLLSLLDERDALKAKIETIQSQRESEIDQILTEVKEFEGTKHDLQAALDQQKLETLQAEEKIRSSELQLNNLEEELKKAMDCLELAQSDLASEQTKSKQLKESVDKLKKEIQCLNDSLEEEKKKAAYTVEDYQNLNNRMVETTGALERKISKLQIDLDATMNDNDTLTHKMNNALKEVEFQKVKLGNLARGLESIGLSASSAMEQYTAQEECIKSDLASLSVLIKELQQEKASYVENLNKVTTNNADLIQEVASLQAENNELIEKTLKLDALRHAYDEMEAELFYTNCEKEDVEERFAFTVADHERSTRYIHHNLEARSVSHDQDLASRDEDINRLLADKDNLRKELDKANMQLKAKNSELEAVKCQLQRDITILNTEVESTKKKLSGVETEKDLLIEKIADMERVHSAELVQASNKLSEVESQKQALQSERDILTTKISNMETNKASLESELQDRIESHNAEVESMRENLTHMQTKLTDAESQSAALKAEMERHIDGLKTELDASHAKSIDLESSLVAEREASAAKYSELETEKASVEAKLQDRIESHNAEVESMRENLTHMETKLTDAESQSAALKAEMELHIDDIKTELEASHAKSIDLESSLVAERERHIDGLKTELDASHAKSIDLESSLVAEREASAAKYSELEAEKTSFEAELQDRIESLKLDLDTTKDKLCRNLTDLTSASRKISEVELQKTMVEAELGKHVEYLESELKGVRATFSERLSSLTSERDSLASKISELEFEKESVETELQLRIQFLQSDHDSMQGKVTQMETRITSVQEDAARRIKEIECQKENAENESKQLIEQLAADLSRAQSTISELEASHAAKQDEFAAKLDENEARKAELRQHIKGLQIELKSSGVNNANLEAALAENRAEMERRISKVESEKQACEALLQERIITLQSENEIERAKISQIKEHYKSELAAVEEKYSELETTSEREIAALSERLNDGEQLNLELEAFKSRCRSAEEEVFSLKAQIEVLNEEIMCLREKSIAEISSTLFGEAEEHGHNQNQSPESEEEAYINLEKLTCKELRERLSANGLPTGGRKAELIQRLQEVLAKPIDTSTEADQSFDEDAIDEEDFLPDDFKIGNQADENKTPFNAARAMFSPSSKPSDTKAKPHSTRGTRTPLRNVQNTPTSSHKVRTNW